MLSNFETALKIELFISLIVFVPIWCPEQLITSQDSFNDKSAFSKSNLCDS